MGGVLIVVAFFVTLGFFGKWFGAYGFIYLIFAAFVADLAWEKFGRSRR